MGRGLRFAADAWLGAHYGVRAQDYVRHNAVWVSLAAVAVVIGLAVFRRLWKKRFGTRNPDPAA